MTTADAYLGSHPGARLHGAARRGRVPFPVLIYLLAILIPLSIQAGPVLLTGVRAVLLVMIAPMAIGLLQGKYGKIYWTDWLFFAHLIWIPIALSMTTPNFVIGQTGSVGVEFIGGYLLGRAYVRDAETFKALLKFLMVVLVLLFPFSVMESLNGRPVLLDQLRKLPVVQTLPAVSIEGRMGLERVQSVLAHPIHYGLFASSMFSMALVGLKGTLPLFVRLIVIAVVAGSVFLSLSSGAILPMVMQTGLFVWAFLFNATKKRWLILVILCAIAYVVIDLLSNRTPIRVFMSYATFSPHNAYWRGIIFDWGYDNIMGNAARGIEPARLFGIGLSDWIRPFFMHSGSMDNFWLVMGVRYGIPGFLTVAAGWTLLLWRVGRTQLDHRPELHQLRRAWMFTFVGLSFTLATVHVWTAIYSYTFFLMGAGVWFLNVPPPEEEGAEGEAAEAEEAPARRSAYSRFAPGENALRNARPPEPPAPKGGEANWTRFS